MKDLHDLFIHEVQVMYNVEKQIVEALPNVIEAVSSSKLKTALKEHLKETEKQVRRLEAVLQELGKPLSEVVSKSMESLLKEADKVIESGYEPNVKDAALINCVQHVEHFEIASYGSLKALAKKFKYDQILDLLEENSREEGNANKTLTEIAEGTIFTQGINEKAKKRAA
ncbi:MAG: DUF892 family protein [Rhabdochlamydiaceae bacterium]|jgi:ferritin-like metal-binding protein YciE